MGLGLMGQEYGSYMCWLKEGDDNSFIENVNVLPW
jgi:hypothetical protein